jgi:hypothetical protein
MVELHGKYSNYTPKHLDPTRANSSDPRNCAIVNQFGERRRSEDHTNQGIWRRPEWEPEIASSLQVIFLDPLEHLYTLFLSLATSSILKEDLADIQKEVVRQQQWTVGADLPKTQLFLHPYQPSDTGTSKKERCHRASPIRQTQIQEMDLISRCRDPVSPIKAKLNSRLAT